MSGSRVLTLSHEYVLYWPKLALRSQSVFTCSAKHAPAKANAKAAVVIAHNFNRILFLPCCLVGIDPSRQMHLRFQIARSISPARVNSDHSLHHDADCRDLSGLRQPGSGSYSDGLLQRARDDARGIGSSLHRRAIRHGSALCCSDNWRIVSVVGRPLWPPSILGVFTLVTPFAKAILRYQGSKWAEFLRSSHRSSLSLSP